MGLKRNLGFKARCAHACALCVVVSACSDDGTSRAPSTGEHRADAASDARPASDASSDGTAWDANAAAEDGGADAASDVAPEAAMDGADADLPDARDAAADAAPSCATLDCDDHIDCTVDTCDDTLGCVHTPSNARCDDHKVCTGTETCNAAMGCEPGAPPVCDDSSRCTFDYCAEQAGGCAHRDVSTSVELLLNGHFDYGENLAWHQLPLFADGSLIWEDAQRAHTADWFAWLGGMSDRSMRVWQAVEVPATTSELTLSGVYAVIPGQGAPALSSYFRVEIRDALTGASYQRALSLSSAETTTLEWVPFSLKTDEPLAGKVLEIYISSHNAVDDRTNFWADTLSLRAKVCPAE